MKSTKSKKTFLPVLILCVCMQFFFPRKIIGDQLLFSVKEIQIFSDFCIQDKCNEDSEFFLKEFEKKIQQTTEPVCIAHIFTYRDFPGGTQGHNTLKSYLNEHAYV